MSGTTIHTIDLEFLGMAGTIGVYLIPHTNGVALVECGPGSTFSILQSALLKHGYTIDDVTDVLLTHIHLDHAGAVGKLALAGARVHVHTAGAPHLIQPEKLISSAKRIYGDFMESLWGEFLPVPHESIYILEDKAQVSIGNLHFQAIDTPGHASHHMSYILEDALFTGDIGGVRLGGLPHIRLPTPPHDLNMEFWRESQHKLFEIVIQEKIKRIIPTHFGIYTDPSWHMEAVWKELDAIEAWIQMTMPANPSLESLRQKYTEWAGAYSIEKGLDPSLVSSEEAANPSFMSADGLYRYWHKFRSKY